jgi:hypothetical protein
LGFLGFWGLRGVRKWEGLLRFEMRFFIEWVGCVRGIDLRDGVGFSVAE